MIPQTVLHGNEARVAAARGSKRPANVVRNWHSLEASSVTHLVEVDPVQGLTLSEAKIRRLAYGPNNCGALESRRITRMLVLLLLGSVVGFMLTAAILNRAAGDRIEVFLILVVMVVGTIVAFTHTLRSSRAQDAMHLASQAAIRVKRGGQETSLKGEELVPGDIIIFGAGDLVPADARLIEAAQLRAQEVALTGRGSGIDKHVSPLPTATPLDERQSMVYLGTTIESGSGVAVVVATGGSTELGKIAAGER